jgi:peptide/nickel transport system substrate-binding protein
MGQGINVASQRSGLNQTTLWWCPGTLGSTWGVLFQLCCLIAVSLGCTNETPLIAAPKNVVDATQQAPQEKRFKGAAPQGAFVVNDMEVGTYGGRLVLASAGNPKTFNPLLGNESSSNAVLRPMFSDCWAFNNGRQEEEPGLCSAYSRSEDGLTYTFTLREGIRWSDGHPITTDDFEFSYGVLMDPVIPNSDRDIFNEGTDEHGMPLFPKFTKIDSRNFQFTLHRPDVLFQYTAGSVSVMPRHRWEAAYKEGRFLSVMGVDTPLDLLVVSGPFIVTNYEPGKRVVMARNPYYWKVDQAGNRLPYLDELEFLIVPDQSAALQRFEAGETHLHEVRAGDYERLKRQESTSDFRLVDLGPSFNTNFLMLNLDDRKRADGTPFVEAKKLNWFRRKNFRKAISHAIDRQSIVRNVMGGRGQPLWAYTSPANRKWHSDKTKKYPYDLEKAAQLLSAEGFKKIDGKLYDLKQRHVEFSMMTNAESDTRIKMLNYIKQDLLRLGISAHIRPTPFNQVVSALRESRAFDVILLGWGTSIPPDPSFSRNVLFSGGQSHSWNPAQQKPATIWESKIDELLRKNTSTADYAERKRYSDEIFSIFSDFQPQIQLVVGHDAASARKRVGNFRPSALRPRTHWNVESLYFK